MVDLALLGLGRLGKEVLKISKEDSRFNVLFGIDNNFSDTKGDIKIPIYKTSQFDNAINKEKPDIIIDFSHPQGTLEIAPKALKKGISMVICTTGFSQEEEKQLINLANKSEAALLLAPNITPGINLLMLFSKIMSEVLKDYDVQILDYHYKDKRDRPSGTALKLARELEKDGRKPEVYGIRAGNIIGKHTILFAGKEDEIEIIHRSYSIRIFARSALEAALKIYGKKGYLEMKDIINIKSYL